LGLIATRFCYSYVVASMLLAFPTTAIWRHPELKKIFYLHILRRHLNLTVVWRFIAYPQLCLCSHTSRRSAIWDLLFGNFFAVFRKNHATFWDKSSSLRLRKRSTLKISSLPGCEVYLVEDFMNGLLRLWLFQICCFKCPCQHSITK
jgi:hypothetical protein